MKNKWLFLDIDGVLNHEDWYIKINKDGLHNCDLQYPYSQFDPECVERVKKILKETNATLVVSSSWRLDKNLPKIFEKIGLPTNFYKTPVKWNQTRGYEINAFLQDHDCEAWMCGQNYAIIDDDNDFDNWQKTHCLFRTAGCAFDEPHKRNVGTGLTEKLTEEIIKHLNKDDKIRNKS